jgi:CheY-like chemotaxis protein
MAFNLNGKALVVDDEPALLEYVQEVLEDVGLEVESCGDGQQALSLLRAAPEDFDLLVTDQTMPGLLGVELVAQARMLCPDLKVILCTGHSEQVDASNARRQGIDCCLYKPVSPQQIWAAAERLLNDEDPDSPEITP